MTEDDGIRIVSRGVTPDEIAAVSAVITGALEELAAAQNVDEAAPVSAWTANQRPLRRTVTPGPGAWRSFSG